MLKKLFLLLLLLVCPIVAFSATTTASGSQVQDGTGTNTLLSSGQWCFGAACFPVTNGSFSGSVTSGTATVTVVNASSTTILTVPSVVIAGATYNWNSFIVASSASISGTGAPYLPCSIGAAYTQTDNSTTWACTNQAGQAVWKLQSSGQVSPSGNYQGYGTPTFSCTAPCTYANLSASPYWQTTAPSGFPANSWIQYLPASGSGSGLFPSINGVVFNTSTTTSRNASYADIVALWSSGSCSGYLKNDNTCSIPSLSGTAGGDLSGSYPNPNVAKVNAAAIPLSTSYIATNSLGQFIAATTPVASFNSRTGAITPASGDYSFNQISGTLAAGQLPIPLAGAGVGIATGPTSGVVSGDVVQYSGTSGAQSDSGIPITSVCQLSGIHCPSSVAPPFSALTSGTNTSATMTVGNGSSLSPTGTGTITATSVPYSGLTGSPPTWNQNTTGNAGSASNLGSGSLGSLPYQSAASTTAFLAGNVAATDQVLVSHGNGTAAQAPTLSNAPALSTSNMFTGTPPYATTNYGPSGIGFTGNGQFVNTSLAPPQSYLNVNPTSVSTTSGNVTFQATNTLANGNWVNVTQVITGAPCSYNFVDNPLDVNYYQVSSVTSTSFVIDGLYLAKSMPNCTSSTVTSSAIQLSDGTLTNISEDANSIITVNTTSPITAYPGDVLLILGVPTFWSNLPYYPVLSVNGTTLTLFDIYGFGSQGLTASSAQVFVEGNRGVSGLDNSFSITTYNNPFYIRSTGNKVGYEQINLQASGPVNNGTAIGPYFFLGAQDSSFVSSTGFAYIDGSVDSSPATNGVISWRSHWYVVDQHDNLGVKVEIDAMPNNPPSYWPSYHIELPTNGSFTLNSGYNAATNSFNGATSFYVDGITSGSYQINIPPISGSLGILSGTVTPGNCVKSDPTGKALVDAGTTCSGGGGGSSENDVASSATPTFSVTDGVVNTITLTTAVTSSTMTGTPVNGAHVRFHICQNATGNFPFAWPTGFHGTMSVGLTALKCSDQSFGWINSSSGWYADSPGVINQ